MPEPRQTLSEHMKISRSERVIQMSEETVPAVCQLLHAVCDRMEGRLNSTHTILKSSIRCALAAAGNTIPERRHQFQAADRSTCVQARHLCGHCRGHVVWRDSDVPVLPGRAALQSAATVVRPPLACRFHAQQELPRRRRAVHVRSSPRVPITR